MSNAKHDEIKGRVKEAAGAISDDDDLKNEGQSDQRAADIKSKVDEAADGLKDAVDDVRSRVTDSD